MYTLIPQTWSIDPKKGPDCKLHKEIPSFVLDYPFKYCKIVPYDPILTYNFINKYGEKVVIYVFFDHTLNGHPVLQLMERTKLEKIMYRNKTSGDVKSREELDHYLRGGVTSEVTFEALSSTVFHIINAESTWLHIQFLKFRRMISLHTWHDFIFLDILVSFCFHCFDLLKIKIPQSTRFIPSNLRWSQDFQINKREPDWPSR